MILEGLDKLEPLQFLSSNRVTLIRDDGFVLFDTASNTAESHKYRAEVKEALNNNEGFEVRFSTTVQDTLIYYSTLYENIVIRVAENTRK